MFIKHSPCPKCGSKDNLGIYSDGSEYCFGCGYYKRSQRTIQNTFKLVSSIQKELFIPPDLTRNIPAHGLQWLYKYNLSPKEIEENEICWSNYLGGLCFLVRDKVYSLVGYQVRNFKKEGKKYISYGSTTRMCETLLEKQISEERLVLVEDIISSIKVNRVSSCIPLFGSKIPLELIRKASERFKSFSLWYDPDKRIESIKQCYRARQQGIEISPIFSNVDPKELNNEEIKEKLK